METAIKKAIEGGYDGHGLTLDSGAVIYDRFLLDPLFWQCLGKAEMWREKELEAKDGTKYKAEYIYVWHSFIDHIAEGGDIDSFFNQLLK